MIFRRLECTGAGVFIGKEINSIDISVPLGVYATVFQAEVIILLAARRKLVTQSTACNISTDSQDDVKSLSALNSPSSLVEEWWLSLKKLG